MRVSIQTNAGEYSAVMRLRAEELRAGIPAAMADLSREVLRTARWYSSGPYKQSTLTRMDHPYARRHSYQIHKSSLKTRRVSSRTVHTKRIGEAFPARINVQSGDFYSSWRFRMQRTAGGGLAGTLSNTSDHAKYLTRYGTKYMIGRPVMQGISRKTRAELRKGCSIALQRAIRKYSVGSSARASTGVPSLGLGGWSSNLQSAFRRGYNETKRKEQEAQSAAR